jgi:hypothetical protein
MAKVIITLEFDSSDLHVSKTTGKTMTCRPSSVTAKVNGKVVEGFKVPCVTVGHEEYAALTPISAKAIEAKPAPKGKTTTQATAAPAGYTSDAPDANLIAQIVAATLQALKASKK